MDTLDKSIIALFFFAVISVSIAVYLGVTFESVLMILAVAVLIVFIAVMLIFVSIFVREMWKD